MTRRTSSTLLMTLSVWTLGAGLVFSGEPGSMARASADTGDRARPNLLFILTDDQGPWTFGAEGHPNAFTPELDRLAAEGARLENAFAVAAVCSPSRAALITSRYPSETGIEDFIPDDSPVGLDVGLTTWPQVLREAGYQTALVGKWHLGHQKDEYAPTRRGYSRFSGWPIGGKRSKDPSMEVEGTWKTFEGQYTSDALADLTMDYIREFRDGPFAVSLHFWAPHANQGVPEGFRLPYKDRTWLPLKEEDLAHWNDLDLVVPNPEFPNLDIPRVERMMREYYASVRSVDRNVGRILRLLDELSLAENTIVVFTADQGYNLGHNGIWHKGNGWWITNDRRDPAGVYPGRERNNLYDNSIRVPAVVRWPRRVAAGTVVTETISFLDWFPTILAMTGTATPDGLLLRGRNALPLLEGEHPPWDNHLFAQHRMLRAYRTTGWKFVRDYGPAGRDELYHLTEDPAERRNLIDSRDPNVVTMRRELEDRLEAAARSISDTVLAPSGR